MVWILTVLRCLFGPNLVILAWTADGVMVRKSSKWGKIWLSSSILPWRSRSIIPKNNRDLNQGVLHLWSKFADPSLNERWVIVRTSSWLTHTDTDPQTQPMTIPEGQNWPRVKTLSSLVNDCIQQFSVAQYLNNRRFTAHILNSKKCWHENYSKSVLWFSLPVSVSLSCSVSQIIILN